MGASPNIAGGDFNGPTFQRFLINPDVSLAPNPSFGATVLAGVPLPLDLDARAIDWKVQRAGAATRYGRFTFSVFWRRHGVLWSGTAQSHSPTDRERLSTKPFVCRDGIPRGPSLSGKSGSRHR